MPMCNLPFSSSPWKMGTSSPRRAAECQERLQRATRTKQSLAVRDGTCACMASCNTKTHVRSYQVNVLDTYLEQIRYYKLGCCLSCVLFVPHPSGPPAQQLLRVLTQYSYQLSAKRERCDDGHTVLIQDMILTYGILHHITILIDAKYCKMLN